MYWCPLSLNDRGGGRGLAVLRVAKCQKRVEEDRQKPQSNRKPRGLSKCARQIQFHQEENHDVDNGNEHQKNPPARLPSNFAKDVHVVDGDYCGPSRLAGLLEGLPKARGDQEEDQDVDSTEQKTANHSTGAATAGVGLGQSAEESVHFDRS